MNAFSSLSIYFSRFRANVIENCSESASGRSELLRTVMTRLEDMHTVIGKTLEHHERVLKIRILFDPIFLLIFVFCTQLR